MTTLERMARACSACNGTGCERTAHGGYRLDGGKCAACGGTGKDLAALREEQAPPPPCATCGGRTWVFVQYVGGETREPCPDCRPEVPR